MTRSKEILVSLLILFGISTVYVHTWLAYFYPSIEIKTYVLWKSKEYKEPLTIAYYMFEIEQLIAWAVCFFAFWLAVREFSKMISQVIFIAMLYFLTQIGFYVWDRNSSDAANNIVYIYIIMAFFYILIPPHDKSKIVNF